MEPSFTRPVGGVYTMGKDRCFELGEKTTEIDEDK